MRLWTAGNALRRSAVTSTRRGFGSSSSSSATAVAENELGKYADMPAVAVHKGYKMVMSLSICRLPPVYTEPAFIREHREWRAEWEERTANQLEIADSLVYQNFPHHFLPSRRELALLREGSQTDILQQEGGTVVKMSELEKLMAEEGLSGLEGQLGGGRKKKKKQEDLREMDKQRVLKEMHNMDRRGTEMLWLVVKYRGSSIWTFPFSSHLHGMTARETLQKICTAQLGEGYAPFFVGTCPMHYRKFTSVRNPEDDGAVVGSKVFYYRAIHLPSGPPVTLSPDGILEDFVWVSRSELAEYVGPSAWYHYRRCLPLDLLPGQESVVLGESDKEEES
ncbi:hypothetical protein FOZ61_006388 [Perkinsus olseni]|uniref:39S ribosomal protein L46, mitochondrial n=1 Tax=Perkinsus olseni TaxID=32597 RepID=A0A7J6LDU9_PEROL|nr:hypothetical protein FOZ61_006388 [Perkinsus olseni]